MTNEHKSRRLTQKKDEIVLIETLGPNGAVIHEGYSPIPDEAQLGPWQPMIDGGEECWGRAPVYVADAAGNDMRVGWSSIRLVR